MVAVGWTGAWFADLEKRDPNRLTLAAGMLNTDLYLYPGEQIRTPSVALMFWSGDRINGHNRFRRLVLAHHSRKVDGSPFYPLCSAFNYRDPQPCGEYSCLTADWAIAMVRRYSMFELTPDVFWLDAGWHTGAGDFRHGKSWANTTGNWTVDRERFPEGLKPVSDAVHEAGAKFMVWFEPERVVKGTQWATEHKEWMLDTEWPEGSEQSTWYLFDLGNDEACELALQILRRPDRRERDRLLPTGFQHASGRRPGATPTSPAAAASRRSVTSKTSTNSGTICWNASPAY